MANPEPLVLELTKTQRKEPKGWCEGYSYTKKGGCKNGKQIWICTWKMADPKCFKLLKTEKVGEEYHVIGAPPSHYHEPDPREMLVEKVRDEIGTKSKSNLLEKRKNVLSDVLNDVTPEEKALLPTSSTLETMAKRARKAEHPKLTAGVTQNPKRQSLERKQSLVAP